MARTTVRELHLNTTALIKNVKEGQTYVIESRGVPVAELRPIQLARRKSKPLPNREAFIRTLPVTESGRILEEDRT